MHVHTLSLNLHTVPNPKRVLKTELGTQNFLPPEMTLMDDLFGNYLTKWEEAPTAVVVFLPALQREGYLDLDGTEASVAPCPTAAARSSCFLGLFSAVVGRSGVGGSNALPVGSTMAAGKATTADNLIFFDDFVAADEGDATEAATTEVVSAVTLTATAGPLATAVA